MNRRLIAALWIIILIMSCVPMGEGFAAPSGSNVNLTQNSQAIAASKKKPKKISIEGPGSVEVGKKITLKATVSPDSADQSVKWKSGDKEIATVSSKGEVKGVKAGTVTITVTSKKDSKVKATWEIKVKEKKKLVSELKITGAKDLDLAGTKKITLKVEVSPTGASSAVKWKSSDTGIATVNSKGVVTAVSTGKVEITATAKDGSKKKDTVTITVTDSGASPTPTPAPTFEIKDGTLLEYNGKSKKVKIPNGVRTIWKEAFKDNTNLQKIIFPETLVEIKENAFSGCVNLKEVSFDTDNNLVTIESMAFYNCPNLKSSFADEVQDVADDAFAEEIPYDDIVWGDFDFGDDDIGDGASSSGSGKSSQRQTHGKSTKVMKHDYEQVSLKQDGNQEPMHRLTLDGEELELTLAGAENADRTFTVSLEEGTADGEAAEKDPGKEVTMVLSAVMPGGAPDETGESLTWRMNGGALLKLGRSGVTRLAFRCGTETVTVPTEGFLAGWAYDALKRRGTAARRFDYTLTMDAKTGMWAWAVDVEGTHYELTEDPLSAIYLTGVKEDGKRSGLAEKQVSADT